MSDAQWSDDRVTTLSKLWLDGLNASQIAKQLGGVTRNAVIGKVYRLGLSGRATPSRPGRAVAVRTPRTPRPARPPALPNTPRPRIVEAMPAPRLEGPGLVDGMAGLGAHACKWPIGDPKAEGFTFCGRLTDSVYCRTHDQLAHRPGKAKPLQGEAAVRRFLRGLAA